MDETKEVLDDVLATLASLTVKVNGMLGLLIAGGVDPNRLLEAILLQCKALGGIRESVEEAVQFQFATIRRENDSTH